VLVKFRIWGNLRFLSHAETMSVFQRACVRAGIPVCHSEGFNPRPRMSLPLPRSVGVESDDELLVLVVGPAPGDTAMEQSVKDIEAGLGEQLPEGCRIVSVRGIPGGKSPLARSATYVLAVRPDYAGSELNNRITDLLARETVIVRRQADKRASRFKDVDVRGFLRSVELHDGDVSVECAITSAGSIRMEEILETLGLNIEELARPIKRSSVEWCES